MCLPWCHQNCFCFCVPLLYPFSFYSSSPFPLSFHVRPFFSLSLSFSHTHKQTENTSHTWLSNTGDTLHHVTDKTQDSCSLFFADLVTTECSCLLSRTIFFILWGNWSGVMTQPLPKHHIVRLTDLENTGTPTLTKAVFLVSFYYSSHQLLSVLGDSFSYLISLRDSM